MLPNQRSCLAAVDVRPAESAGSVPIGLARDEVVDAVVVEIAQIRDGVSEVGARLPVDLEDLDLRWRLAAGDDDQDDGRREVKRPREFRTHATTPSSELRTLLRRVV